MLKISIITVCYNSAKYIESAIQSVANQTYSNIEYIIVDGGSTDKTLEIIQNNKGCISQVISESDNGIYDAMNKGYKLATGDIIGILNSDDYLSTNLIIEEIVEEFASKKIDAVYGDIQFVNPDNLKKVVRYYSSRYFKPWLFRFGMMPPHASFYAKKEIFETFGLYKTHFKIAADFDLLIRLMYQNRIKTNYLNKDVVTMRTGGVSTDSLSGKILLNKESIQACKENGIYTNMLFLFAKYLVKSVEILFFKKKRK